MPTKLKQRKSLVWLGLASGQSHAELAQKWNCSEGLVAKVAGEGREQVAAMRSRMIDQACGQLAAGLIEAVQVLREAARDADTWAVRVQAARALLDKLVVLRPPEQAQASSAPTLATVPTEVLRRLVLTAGGTTLALEELVRPALGAPQGPEGGPPPFTGTPGPSAGEAGAPAPPLSLLPPGPSLA